MKTVRSICVFLLSIWLSASVMIASRAESSMLLGDDDGDSEICITDATMIQRDVAMITMINEGCRRCADVRGDDRGRSCSPRGVRDDHGRRNSPRGVRDDGGARRGT